MFRKGIIAVSGIVLLTLVSCRTISSLIRNDRVIARMGKEKLYMSDVGKYIPDGISSEDSLMFLYKLAQDWAAENAFLDVATAQLSKSEQDVSAELEEYRRALLKYRYEQLYVNQRLDTLVQDKEIEDYYNSADSGKLALGTPIVKARYMLMENGSPSLAIMRKKMNSRKALDMAYTDSASFFSSLLYKNFADKWIELSRISSDTGADYDGLLALAGEGRFIEKKMEERNQTVLIYIDSLIPAGNIPPLEFCRGGIRDIIVSGRKRDLVVRLEQELLEDALSKGKVEFYINER